MTDAAEPLLAVEELIVRTGPHLAVNQVSLAARPGAITAIIGPNGAGKTSLLEAIVGVRAPVSGRVRVGGKLLSTFRDGARTFAYLPDQSDLPAEASVRTLVDHALAHASARVPVDELRRLLEIDPLLDLGAGVLSRGERQRVLLFSTLVLGRPIVALDEPFSVFDPLKLRDVVLAVRTLARAGAAVVASVHQLGDAEKVADRILLLAEGRAVAFGTLEELRTMAGDSAMSLEDIFVALLSRGSRAA